MCKSSVGVQSRGQKSTVRSQGRGRPLAIGHWPTIDTGPRNPQARRSRTRSRSLARLAQLAARPCCRLVVVVVLRTPPAELSDAAVRPDQRHAKIATSSAALWTHEGGVAHRHGCVLVSGLVVVRSELVGFSDAASPESGRV